MKSRYFAIIVIASDVPEFSVPLGIAGGKLYTSKEEAHLAALEVVSNGVYVITEVFIKE